MASPQPVQSRNSIPAGPAQVQAEACRKMNLKSLLVSGDEKTVRVLRRVLSDLDIAVEHSSVSDDAIHRITRNRYEAIIVDCTDPQESGHIFRAVKAAPVNKRALSIALVESAVGLRGGFDMGAHFVLHKPVAVERAKGSFRAVRALMKAERRLQLRVSVEIPVECIGAGRYPARTLDLCEGGMAIRFTSRKAKERMLRFSFALPGTEQKVEVWGDIAWEGADEQVGIRFQNLNDSQRELIRGWLNRQCSESEPDDPPSVCQLTRASEGGCYLTTGAPFPKSTLVILSIPNAGADARAGAVVRIVHPERGMGVEFLRYTPEQQNQAGGMAARLRASGPGLKLHVEPDGLEPQSEETAASTHAIEDSLVRLFRHKAQLSADDFLEQIQQETQFQESR